MGNDVDPSLMKANPIHQDDVNPSLMKANLINQAHLVDIQIKWSRQQRMKIPACAKIFLLCEEPTIWRRASSVFNEVYAHRPPKQKKMSHQRKNE